MMTAEEVSSLSKATFWSRFWFSWNKPLINLGREQPLNFSDLPAIDKSDSSKFNKEYICKLWEHEKKNYKGTPSLARALFRDYIRSTWASRCLVILNGSVKIGQAVFLGMLLDRLENPKGYEAYIWAFAIIGCGLIAFPSKQHSFFMLYRQGLHYKSGLTAAIFSKTLRLPSIRNDDTTCGHLTNLASNDVERFQLTAIYANLLLASPVEILAILGVGIWSIGPVFCFGYALLILVVVPLQFWLGRRFVYLRHKVAHLTDARVTLVSQAVAGARVLKLQGWELELERKIASIRSQEIQRLRSTSRLKACNDATYYLSSLFLSVSVFAVYVAFGGRLTPSIVYPTYTLFNQLQYSVTKHIPNAIMGLSECYVACQRIERFFELPNQREVQAFRRMEDDEKKESDNDREQCIAIEDGTVCYWDNNSENKIVALRLSSLRFSRGKLYCVVGSVGSSKSALLQAIIGELPVASGQIYCNGTISYASQDPWVMDGTAQENITMGLELNIYWYQRVVKACCLESDFESFPGGDQTIVGDRGVQLSGGQKARLALARALYCDSDIFVLDDPLSAVDSRVAKHIFSNAIQELGLRRGKCIVLVTHQLQFTNGGICISMHGGTIACCGSFNDCALKTDNILSVAMQNDVVQKDIVQKDGCEKFDPIKEIDRKVAGTATKDNSFEEKRQTGVITRKTWLSYMEAMGGRIVAAFFLFVFSLTQAIYLVTMYVVGLWAKSENQDVSGWYGIVFGLTALTSLAAVMRALMSFNLFLRASKVLHNTMLGSVLRATIQFYDTNPIGRILNRFASDIGIVDEQLPLVMYEFGVGFIMFGGSIISAMIILPLILVVFPFLLLAFLFYREMFVKTTRELKRLEGLSKSPIYAMMSESMAGIATIRANYKDLYFASKFETRHDTLIKSQFAFISVSRWFATKLDFLSFVFLSASTLSAVIIQDLGWFSLDAAILGLALSLLLQLASSNFPYMVRQSAEVTNHMVSVERVWEFGHSIPQEAPLVTELDKDQNDWPKEPSMVVKNISTRYRKNLPLCLHDLSFSIQPGERVGVVGRTGAGKTSLLQVLFRVLEAETGSIMIGGVDISTLGLHKLRTNMAVITQTPVLFSGCTIRENLDPYPIASGEEENERLKNALRAVHMLETIESIPEGLDGVVSEGGSNFSVGQRQLLCLARALLANSQILVLDEATANVDQVTDSLLQQTLRERFSTATIIAIAHRIDTIIDYDKILVLGNGKLLEYGSPYALLENPKGQFTSMVDSTGSTMAALLKQKVKA